MQNVQKQHGTLFQNETGDYNVAIGMNSSLKITSGSNNVGVGGNTLKFSKHFKHVNAIELSKINCHVLKNNVIKVYNRENVNIIVYRKDEETR